MSTSKVEHGGVNGKTGGVDVGGVNGKTGCVAGETVDLDRILREEVGQLGRYQLVTLALAVVPVMFGAFTSSEYIFTTARVPTRCLIPECDSAMPAYAPPWLANAVPANAAGFDNCARYSNSSEAAAAASADPYSCPAALFDPTRVVACEGYVYEDSNSVVYDFDLGCDEWRRSLIGSMKSLGSLLVLPVTGFISDRWGRKVALTVNAFNTAWLGLVRSFANSYESFLALELVEATIGAGTFASCHILVTELTGPKYRVVTGGIVSTVFALGQALLGLIAWGVQPWRTFTQVVYAPQLLVLSYFWLVSESVRWLLSKGRYEEAERILKKVANTNNRELSEKSLRALRETAEAQKLKEKPVEAWLPILVFRCRRILVRCLVCPVWWVTNTLVYYGMNVNAVNLSGNRYLNYVYVALVEVPGFWTAILLLDRVGRKPLLIAAYTVCAACQFAYAFLPQSYTGLSLALYLIGKYSIAMVMTSLYIYTGELFPTKYRHSLLAFCSMVGRLGSIAAPLTPALAQEVWEPLPSVLFGGCALLSALLVCCTPETLGCSLPDTMDEAAGIGTRPRSPHSS